MREGDFVISIVSFLTQQPSTEYLELLEASAVHSIGYEALQVLYRNFPEFYHTNVRTPRWVGYVFQRPEELRLGEMLRFRDVHKK
jgi:hypothetical protein